MSLLTRLFSRSHHDQAVELFLQEMLLHLPHELKSFRLVSTEWNNFIKLKIWGNKRAKKYLLKRLFKSWISEEPVKKVKISEELPWNNDFIYIKEIACDDEILLLIGEQKGMKRVYVFDLVNLKQNCSALLELETQRNSENQIRVCIGPSYFGTILTEDKWLNAWTKSGSLIDKIIIDEEPKYLRLIKAVRSMIFVVESKQSMDNRVILFKLEEGKLVKLNSVMVDVKFGLTRTIESDGQHMFYTGHDKVVQVWEVGKETPTKVFSTGFVVDMVLKDNYLFTVGSTQNAGVHIWDTETGTKLESLYYLETYFDKITLGVNQILLEGFRSFLLVIDFGDVLKKYHQSIDIDREPGVLRAMGKTKLVRIISKSDQLKTIIDISISDYWSNL